MRLPQPRAIALAIFGMVVVSALGWAFLAWPIGQALVRASYDLPFALRSRLATPEVCLVVMDEKSARALHQPMDHWDRRLHAELVRTLTAAGARAILLDLIFDFETFGADPSADDALAEAFRASGRVFLGGGLRAEESRGVLEERIVPPAKAFRQAAAGWGLLVFRPVDPDYGVRQIFPGTDEVASATWKVARFLGAPLPETPTPEPQRWINYYGPPGAMANVGFHEALRPGELAPNFFRDRIVVVGGRASVGSLLQQKDDFVTPYTHWGNAFAPGVEIHATTLLNLLRGDWLRRASPSAERWLVILYGIGASALLSIICTLCPFRTAGAASVLALLMVAAACWSAWHQRVWFDWLVPVAVQTPAALFCALGSNYLLETRRRAAIRRAFSLYLSPHMANEIAEARFDLKPGGKLVEATMMFTDLKGFTSLSEQIQDPRQISEVLVSYFNNTTKHILDNRGTIIKYVGDAVYATWGAPLADRDHAYHAVLAAWGMHQFGKLDVHGHQLITRIGVNTGTALAGNLGSEFRFDYTLIGDAVNLASRLEGLNKFLGTKVLLSQATWDKVSDRFAARLVGRFKVQGKEAPVAIYELLGPKITDFVQAAMDVFGQGLHAFGAGDFEKAASFMEKTCKLRDGGDGPAEFYLSEIARLRTAGIPPGWEGVIELSGK